MNQLKESQELYETYKEKYEADMQKAEASYKRQLEEASQSELLSVLGASFLGVVGSEIVKHAFKE